MSRILSTPNYGYWIHGLRSKTYYISLHRLHRQLHGFRQSRQIAAHGVLQIKALAQGHAPDQHGNRNGLTAFEAPGAGARTLCTFEARQGAVVWRDFGHQHRVSSFMYEERMP